jgi:phage terminase small subunit
MGKAVAKGKAMCKHDSSRPEPKSVLKALENDDVEALRLALSPRQRRFAEEYVVDFNGAAAVIRAGYSPSNADRQAYILKHHKGVAYLIDHLQRSKEAKIISISPDYVIQKVTEIITKEGARDGDKLRALELLARHLGMFIDRTEITGKDGDAIRIQNEQIESEAADFLNRIDSVRKRVQKEKTTH